jgi:hypothetical protein
MRWESGPFEVVVKLYPDLHDIYILVVEGFTVLRRKILRKGGLLGV